MHSTNKTLTLLEQKRQQWAKEREEMVGLCGLWGHQRSHPTEKMSHKDEEKPDSQFRRNSLLPPIQAKNNADEGTKEDYNSCRPEEESETSGYLSDSPKHTNDKEPSQDNRYGESQQTFWSGSNNDNYWAEKKMYKNYKNEKWAQQSTESWLNHAKNSWYGTPESTSSDDGSRARWGDKGVGVGHLWDPVVHQPDSRLPQVTESYRQTPKWVERGLKQADILVIHHPDDEVKTESQINKNFLLGQNVPLPPEIIEERERKRKKALEHQNAIRKQLEERENKRREEKENRMREERLEEERIRREQEIERMRYEEEQRKSKDKEEKEKRKEEAMKEALEMAEKMAKEEKKSRKQVHIVEDDRKERHQTRFEKMDLTEAPLERKRIPKTPKPKNTDKAFKRTDLSPRQKDSASQFEQILPANGVQFLNMNNLPMEGGLALVLDTPPTDNNLLLPTDGVQLALLMSPGNMNHGQLIPLPTPAPSNSSGERVLTPSKYRLSERSQTSPRNKATQTQINCCPVPQKLSRTGSRSRKHNRRSGRISGHSDSSEKSTSLERTHAHYQCTLSSRFRSRSQPRLTIDDRPKWGINRPTIQYKKQSEKDPYYQRKLRQRQKKTSDIGTSTELKTSESAEPAEEKLLESDIRMLRFETDEEAEPETPKPDVQTRTDFILKNGYRMNSNPSSPMFVAIKDEEPKVELKSPVNLEINVDLEEEKVNVDVNNVRTTIDLPIKRTDVYREEDAYEDEIYEDDKDDPPVPGSASILTHVQLEAIQQIATLRQGLKKLQNEFATSRSITPFSDAG